MYCFGVVVIELLFLPWFCYAPARCFSVRCLVGCRCVRRRSLLEVASASWLGCQSASSEHIPRKWNDKSALLKFEPCVQEELSWTVKLKSLQNEFLELISTLAQESDEVCSLVKSPILRICWGRSKCEATKLHVARCHSSVTARISKSRFFRSLLPGILVPPIPRSECPCSCSSVCSIDSVQLAPHRCRTGPGFYFALGGASCLSLWLHGCHM